MAHSLAHENVTTNGTSLVSLSASAVVQMFATGVAPSVACLLIGILVVLAARLWRASEYALIPLATLCLGGTISVILMLQLASPAFKTWDAPNKVIYPWLAMGLAAVAWAMAMTWCVITPKRHMLIVLGWVQFHCMRACCRPQHVLRSALQDPGVAYALWQLYRQTHRTIAVRSRDIRSLLDRYYSLPVEYGEMRLVCEHRAAATVLYVLIQTGQLRMGALANHVLHEQVLLRMAVLGDLMDAVTHDDATKLLLSRPSVVRYMVCIAIEEFAREIGNCHDAQDPVDEDDATAVLQSMYAITTPPGHCMPVPLYKRLDSLLRASELAAESEHQAVEPAHFREMCMSVLSFVYLSPPDHRWQFVESLLLLWRSRRAHPWEDEDTACLIRTLHNLQEPYRVCIEMVEIPFVVMLASSQDASRVADSFRDLRPVHMRQYPSWTAEHVPVSLHAIWVVLTMVAASRGRSLALAELPRLRGLARWVAQSSVTQLDGQLSEPMHVPRPEVVLAGLAGSAWLRRRHAIVSRGRIVRQRQVAGFFHNPLREMRAASNVVAATSGRPPA